MSIKERRADVEGRSDKQGHAPILKDGANEKE